MYFGTLDFNLMSVMVVVRDFLENSEEWMFNGNTSATRQTGIVCPTF